MDGGRTLKGFRVEIPAILENSFGGRYALRYYLPPVSQRLPTGDRFTVSFQHGDWVLRSSTDFERNAVLLKKGRGKRDFFTGLKSNHREKNLVSFLSSCVVCRLFAVGYGE